MADEIKNIRTVINFPAQTAARLQRLKKYLEAKSYIDVIRKALMLLEICVDVIKAGGKIIKEDKDGKQTCLAIPEP